MRRRDFRYPQTPLVLGLKGIPCLPCLACKVGRAGISLLRSVHELIWAMVFLAAMGRSELVAVVALAIPYAGTFAKVFSEMIEESPRDAGRACDRWVPARSRHSPSV